jgi:hypothetical protein
MVQQEGTCELGEAGWSLYYCGLGGDVPLLLPIGNVLLQLEPLFGVA